MHMLQPSALRKKLLYIILESKHSLSTLFKTDATKLIITEQGEQMCPWKQYRNAMEYIIMMSYILFNISVIWRAMCNEVMFRPRKKPSIIFNHCLTSKISSLETSSLQWPPWFCNAWKSCFKIFSLCTKSLLYFGTGISFSLSIFLKQISCNFIWAATWQNQQNELCIQRRLRSAWASTQSIRAFTVRFMGS